MTISPVSLVAIAAILAALGLAWTRRFLAVGALVMANIVVFLLTAFGPTRRVAFGTASYESPVIHQELALRGELLAQADPMAFLQLLTSMFVHADPWHLFGNVIVLLAFALPFEERIGHRRFLVIYLGTGLAGTLSHAVSDWGSPGLLMGASGAVFGVIGAFAGSFPSLVVPLPLPLVFMMVMVRMRVIVAAAVFAGIQFLYLAWVSNDPNSPLASTAYLAHLGGLGAGLLVGFALARTGQLKPQGRRVAVDLGLLAPFAQDPGSTRALDQMKANQDEPAIFQAWLDRFFRSATCPTCKGKVIPKSAGEVQCQAGHRFDVRQGSPVAKPV